MFMNITSKTKKIKVGHPEKDTDGLSAVFPRNQSGIFQVPGSVHTASATILILAFGLSALCVCVCVCVSMCVYILECMCVCLCNLINVCDAGILQILHIGRRQQYLGLADI